MKTTLIKKTSMFFTVSAVMIFLQIFAFGQEDMEIQTKPFPSLSPTSIVGVWTNVITPVDCQTGVPFGYTIPGLLTYHSDGTIAETAGPPPGLSRTPGHGVWRRIDSRHYEGSFVFLLFDSMGNFVGTEKLVQNIQLNQIFGLNRDANSFTDTATFQLYDPNGNPVPNASGCARAVATRYE